MLSLLIVILMIVMLFKMTVFMFRIMGKIIGGMIGIIGWLILGGLAVTAFGLALIAFPIILFIGIMAIIAAAMT